jgi:hypothetical protein
MYVPLGAGVVFGFGTTVGDVEGASDNGQDGATVTIMGAANGLADGMSDGMLVVGASEEGKLDGVADGVCDGSSDGETVVVRSVGVVEGEIYGRVELFSACC